MSVVFLAFLLVLGCEAENHSNHFPEVCMGELGCFGTGPPFFHPTRRPISRLPEGRKKIDTKFVLFDSRGDPRNRSIFSNLDRSLDKLRQSAFNPSKNVTIMVPGYISKLNHKSLFFDEPLMKAIASATGNNVFMVDWTGGDGPIYSQAIANARVVGAEIALFVQKLQKLAGVKPESVHLIGHSLGCHVTGYAGKRIKNLGRITSLDAAGPFFTGVDPVVRLHRSDALFVDAIHTNDAEIVFQGFGLGESIAHVDFFPNGGHLQPGCKDMGSAIAALFENPSFDKEVLDEVWCNHQRVLPLFLSSVQPQCQLVGTLCPSWQDFKAGRCGLCRGGEVNRGCVPFGWHADRYPRQFISNGKSLHFYLNTTDSPPWCVSQTRNEVSN